jgi:O-acetyl-ADP-ribose deacetylase (regulator of RNase III)
MIKEVSGDILLTDAQAIAHGVAPMDHFDRGLALSLRKNYPSMAKDFRHYCHLENPKPGEVWMWGGVGGVRIFNLMTQEPAKHQSGHPGEATLHNVNLVLRELVKKVEEEGITSLALPRLATGYGNLSWDEVRPLIHEKLGELDIPIFIYTTFRQGVKAEEGLETGSKA